MHDSLGRLVRVWTGTGVDAWWHHSLDLDPEELGRHRRHQMMALARYARQPLGQWEEVGVDELDAWYGELGELLKRENAPSPLVEEL